jgi:NDP-4-keto-2,6-dideoxyhexose 3-C-methyltransferase
MYKTLRKCRICGNEKLTPILDLGTQTLTGVFPKRKDQRVTSGPLQLVKCDGQRVCGLVQLAHSYDLGEMYGENYGYRSGLNQSMVKHLTQKVRRIERLVELRSGDLVIDIGSNDGTTLSAYKNDLALVGIDPTGEKFRQYYPRHVGLIPDFFSADLVKAKFPNKKAKVVTSFSMFYDLEDPLGFMRQVYDVLEEGGIWVFEQSYLPAMLKTNSYDTACHEHLEYYGLAQIKWMTDKVGLSIVDVEFNDVNGGSFSITAAKKSKVATSEQVESILGEESAAGLGSLEPYRAFEQRTRESKKALRGFLESAKSERKSVAALGASTKGNVVLQYCDITTADLRAVGEVNADKFGCFTPGTLLPIEPETETLKRNPDHLLVLPWHFRKFFLEARHLKGRSLVFALPTLEVVRT